MRDLRSRLATAGVALLLAGCTANVTPSAARIPEASAAPTLAPVSSAARLQALRGTWDYRVTDADPDRVRQIVADAAREAGNSGADISLRYGFDGERWWQGFVLDGESSRCATVCRKAMGVS